MLDALMRLLYEGRMMAFCHALLGGEVQHFDFYLDCAVESRQLGGAALRYCPWGVGR